LAGPIKADLHLTDTELGALGGFAFALLYSTMGLPLAWLADRRGRTRVIAASLAVWSAFTALCGAVSGFWAMFVCRLGVGVGEAGGVAPSYALISDTFPAHQRRVRWRSIRWAFRWDRRRGYCWAAMWRRRSIGGGLYRRWAGGAGVYAFVRVAGP
jgi:MFS family permease